VHIADSIRRYILNIVNGLRNHQDVQQGLSTRAGVALFTAARALAFIHERDFAIPDDVKRLLMPVLSHRLKITAEAEMENVSPESIINEVTAGVPVPTIEHE
jgi:MoxR-like ATPase